MADVAIIKGYTQTQMHSASFRFNLTHNCVNIYMIAYLILKHAKFVSPMGVLIKQVVIRFS